MHMLYSTAIFISFNCNSPLTLWIKWDQHLFSLKLPVAARSFISANVTELIYSIEANSHFCTILISIPICHPVSFGRPQPAAAESPVNRRSVRGRSFSFAALIVWNSLCSKPSMLSNLCLCPHEYSIPSFYNSTYDRPSLILYNINMPTVLYSVMRCGCM